MPEISATTAKMLSRNHHSAPKFDNKPASLAPFLDDVTQVAQSCGLSPKQQIEWAVRYAPDEVRELWEMQESVGTDDWDQFKKELFELYPGSSGERKYSIVNLQTLVEKQASVKIKDTEDFGEYSRVFLTMATYLKKKKHLTDRENSVYFFQGLNPSFRDKVQGQLKAENPTHHTDNPYSVPEISKAALFILSCDHTDVDDQEASSVPIKKEMFDLSHGYDNLNINALVEEIAKRISSLEKQQATGGPNLPRLRSNHCVFCSDPEHYLSSCPHAAEYIQKGLCQKKEGQIVLPNGNRILAKEMPGRNLKEQLDNWHRTNNPPKISTNFVGATEFKNEYIWPTKPQDSQAPSEMTKREEEELQILKNLVASTQKKIENKKKYAASIGKEGVTTRSRAQQAPEERGPAAPAERAVRPEPQFRYVTPIEDPALITKIAQQSLDTPITISTRELLSVAPDIRCHIKDQLVTKRVATSATNLNSAFIETVEEEEIPSTLMANVPADKIIVAKHTEELRVIDIEIQGVKVVATVDDGSQIIAIRQDIWE